MWLIFAFSAAILWGLNYAILERLLQDVKPLSLYFFTFLLAAVVELIIFVVFRKTIQADVGVIVDKWSELWPWALLATLVIVAGNFCIIFAIDSKNATVASLIEITYPFFVILFSWILFQQLHLNAMVIAGGILSFLGIGLVVWGGRH